MATRSASRSAARSASRVSSSCARRTVVWSDPPDAYRAMAVSVSNRAICSASPRIARSRSTAYRRLYAVDRERAILGDAEQMARLLTETAMARYASCLLYTSDAADDLLCV